MNSQQFSYSQLLALAIGAAIMPLGVARAQDSPITVTDSPPPPIEIKGTKKKSTTADPVSLTVWSCKVPFYSTDYAYDQKTLAVSESGYSVKRIDFAGKPYMIKGNPSWKLHFDPHNVDITPGPDASKPDQTTVYITAHGLLGRHFYTVDPLPYWGFGRKHGKHTKISGGTFDPADGSGTKTCSGDECAKTKIYYCYKDDCLGECK